MKQLTIIFTALMVISCNSNSGSKKFISLSDTTKIQAMYIDVTDSLRIHSGIVFEVIRDAVVLDSVLNVKKVKDSLYYYKPTNDTSNMWKMILKPIICTDRDVDSCILKLSNIVKEINKQDSLKLKNKLK